MRMTNTNAAFMNAKAMMLGFIICIFAVSAILITPIGSYAEDQTQDMAARIESTGEEFDTLQAAIDAASSGDTIIVLRDLNETSSVSGKELTIDLDDHTISGEGIVGTPLLSVNDKAVVSVKNGTMRDGNGKSDYDGGKRTGGAGAIFIYDSSVNVESVSFIDNKSTMGGSLTGASIYANASTLNIDTCTFDNTNPESPADTVHATVSGDMGSELFINNSLFTHQYKYLNLNNCVSSTIENTDFKDSKLSSKAPSEYICIRVDKTDVTTSFINCSFADNDLLLKSESSILKVEGSTSTNNVVLDSCIFTGNKTQANRLSNGLSFIIDINTSDTSRKANVTMRDTLVADNETGCSAVRVGRGGSLTMDNSVVKNNNTAQVQPKAKPQGAGISFSGLSLKINEGSAVYNNTLISEDTNPLRANDVYIDTTQSKGSVDAAEAAMFADFDDDTFDFSALYWKDDNSGNFEKRPGECTNGVFYYTIMDKYEVFVATINGTDYETLEEAFENAKDGDTIEIVAKESKLSVKESIPVSKNLTLELNGHNVRFDSQDAGTYLFDISNCANLTIKNTNADDKDKGGISQGSILVEEGGKLLLSDPMTISKIVNFGDLTVDGLVNKLDVTLDGDSIIKLGDAYKDLESGDCSIKISLDQSTLSYLNKAHERDETAEKVVIDGGNDNLVAATSVSGINSTVRKLYENGQLILSAGGVIYISGTHGNDDNTGESPDRAVKTFERARELLEKGKAKVILVCGTVTVDSEETWSLPEGTAMIRDRDFKDAMVKVAQNGSLTLTDVTLDGGSNSGLLADDAIIRVEKDGELVIDKGAVLTSNINRKKDATRYGGAVYSEGSVVMKDGVIKQCEAGVGGGICQKGGSFTMTGGRIENNKARYQMYYGPDNSDIEYDYSTDPPTILHPSRWRTVPGAGGGVMLISGAHMVLGTKSSNDDNSNQPVIKNNYTGGSGGGIAMGAHYGNNDWYNDYSSGTAQNAGTKLEMYSGIVQDNEAEAAGGGIFVQCSMNAYVYGGAILDNTAGGSSAYFAGGGIYVNGLHSVDNWTYDKFNDEFAESEKDKRHGFLYLENAEIANNTANWLGGALAACNVSKTIIGDASTAIHDNQSENDTKMNGNRTVGDNVDIFLSQISHWGFTNMPHPLAYVSQYMINEGEYEWRNANSAENELFSNEELYYNSESIQMVTRKTSKDEEMKSAISGAKVLIQGNYSGSNGGGLGSNGIIVIGSILPKVDVSVEKNWDESTDKIARPTKLKFNLYRAEGTEGKAELYKSVEVEPDEEGVFAYTWKDLLKNVPNTETEYVYTVTEDLTYKAVDADGNPLNLEELYDSSIEHAEDSSREIQCPQVDGTVATMDQVIKNFVITNSLREETIEPTEEKEEDEVKGLNEDEKTEEVKAESEPETKAKVKGAKTGDDNALIFFAAMMIMAAAGLFGLRLSRKR